MRRAFPGLVLGLAVLSVAAVTGRQGGAPSFRHPAIGWETRPTTDAVAALNQRIIRDEIRLERREHRGYLESVLDALDIPVESQMLVYSETSLQSEHITRDHPRALYFNDTTAVGWVQGSESIEVSAFDVQQGVVFYVLSQEPAARPHFSRSTRCLECHLSPTTLGVPGLLTMSMLPMSDDPNEYAVGWAVDHRTPMDDRWGGWFVTGRAAPAQHLGNVPVYGVEKGGVRAAVAPRLATVDGTIDVSPYLTPHSDIVALMVLNHQTHMTNLLTRMNWTARAAAVEGRDAGRAVADQAVELVDYLLFVDEAPLPAPVEGTTSFATIFAARGPADGRGRSLRQFDLRTRLFRYPCSYMIYTPAFDALPAAAKQAVYDRLWHVLGGAAADPVYGRLSAADRRAIIEILRDTKPDLPAVFR
ncbi:MAG: hypothetical protein FJW23_16290 [Acidimicrobiia bacterium]|nr:hypothetical protein [Acidimicrobiia bacterium]